MSVAIDLTGTTVGRLTVLRRNGAVSGGAAWLALCDCGTEKTVSGASLRSGKTVSCGCWRREKLAEGRSKAQRPRHGASHFAEYDTWRGMLRRCQCITDKAYPHYGGRGISVCPEWREDFYAFREHAGPRPSSAHSIDRIDNDGNYEPGNVRWATASEQARNTRAFKNGLIHLTKMALIERVKEREGRIAELEAADCRWIIRIGEIREASGLGARPMLTELPAAIGELLARAEAAEARVKMLEEALEQAASWFEGYAAEHYAKARTAPDRGEQHGRETKGKTNADRAKAIRAASALERGKP